MSLSVCAAEAVCFRSRLLGVFAEVVQVDCLDSQGCGVVSGSESHGGVWVFHQVGEHLHAAQREFPQFLASEFGCFGGEASELTLEAFVPEPPVKG